MANKFDRIQFKAEVLSDLYKVLSNKEKDVHTEYKRVGKTDEQDKDWRTGELLWEDEEKTIPKYRDKYEYVEIPNDELTDDRKMQISVLVELMTALDNLM